jgi:hypothetical protein
MAASDSRAGEERASGDSSKEEGKARYEELQSQSVTARWMRACGGASLGGMQMRLTAQSATTSQRPSAHGT